MAQLKNYAIIEVDSKGRAGLARVLSEGSYFAQRLGDGVLFKPCREVAIKNFLESRIIENAGKDHNFEPWSLEEM